MTHKALLKALGDEVRSQRAFLGMTQKELAGHLDLTTATIQNIEQARQSPSLMTIIKIADGLGLYPSEILDASERRAGGDPIDMTDTDEVIQRHKDRLKARVVRSIESL